MTLLESLQNIGFTSYEAKVLVALMQNKSATVSTLNADSGVPSSAVYGALKKLEKKGIIELENAKPIRYKCLSPDATICKLKRDFEDECAEVLNQLEQIYSTSSDEGCDDEIWTIRGVKNVVDKIIEFVEAANENILVLTSSTPFETLANNYPSSKKDYIKIMQLFNKKSNRGVNIRFICSSEAEASKIRKMLPFSSIKVNDLKDQMYDLKSFAMVVDNSEILLSTIKDSDDNPELTAIWSGSKDFSNALSHLLNARWEISESYYLGA